MASEHTLQLSILLAGGLIVLALLTKSGLRKIRISSVVGYIMLGFLLRLADLNRPFLSTMTQQVFEFLANIGVICLLFRIGLESNLKGLLGQLHRARLIWLGNILLSGILGYIAAYFLIGLALIPSLVIGVALTATSVSIPVAVWQETNAIRSPAGELLIDVAGLDDISAIALMALLFAMVPIYQEGMAFSMLPTLMRAFGWVLLKLTAFGIFCFLFSRYAEHPITRFFEKVEPAPDPMLMITGIGFVIAALAGLLGFSVAIGAFFAGLVFSRDPEAVKMETSIESLYEIFIPFFFINIGLGINPNVLLTALGLGTVLLVVAVLGKIIGTVVPASFLGERNSSLLLGVSMVPRAEIAMVIVQQGHKMGESVLPYDMFAAMVMLSAATCIFSPIFIRLLLQRWPQTSGKIP